MTTPKWVEELQKIPKENLCPQDEYQLLYFNLCKDESYSQQNEDATNYVVGELEKLVEHLKKGRYPMIYGVKLPEDGVKNKNIIIKYEIILSHPWGG